MSQTNPGEILTIGSRISLQASALERLGENVAKEFVEADTPGGLLAFIDKYSQHLTQAEIGAFSVYCDQIAQIQFPDLVV